jgi:hypothetical protein
VRLGSKNPSVWQALLGSLLAAIVPVITVLGAVLLSLPAQLQEEPPVVRRVESGVPPTIPTGAMAIPLLDSFDPASPAAAGSAGAVRAEVGPGVEDTTPSSTPGPATTPGPPLTSTEPTGAATRAPTATSAGVPTATSQAMP